MADNLLFRGGSLAQTYTLSAVGSSIITFRDQAAFTSTISLPGNYKFVFNTQPLEFSLEAEEANIEVPANASYASGSTYDPVLSLGATIFPESIEATAITPITVTVEHVTIAVSSSISIEANTLNGLLYTSSEVSTINGISQASGLTYSPVFSRNVLITTSTNYITGYTYNPVLKNIVLLDTIFATGLCYTPTLAIGSTILVTTVTATGRTLRPNFQGVGLPSQYTGTTDILDSYPSLRKAILNSGNQENTSIVIAGQIGLKDGDILIYLGNGQWKRR